MDTDNKEHLGEGGCSNEQELMDRRGFLLSLKKWSKIVIGGALLGNALLNAGPEKQAEAAAWANRGGGGGAAWANRAGGGGAAVVKPGGGGAAVVRPGGSAAVAPGGAAWANRAGAGGAAWANRGAAWANRGGAWVNRF
jgi:hypothetical protein